LTAVQLLPLFVDRYTPPQHAAKIFIPEIASERTELLVIPEEVQLLPLFVDLGLSQIL
jgi:hypothetical protein